MASGALLDPDLESNKPSGAPEALEGFKSYYQDVWDHSQLEGEDNTGARSQEFVKEVEDVKVNPSATSLLIQQKNVDDSSYG